MEYSKMKKTFVAAAVLGALAGSAFAADVTLYGVVDTGLMYQRTDSDKSGESAVNKLTMESGLNAGSRFGLKGTEDLGNGYSVGFVLENGFDSDTGAISKYGEQRNRLFGREATLNFNTPFGTLGMGRMGNLNSANGSYGITGAFSPFGTSYKGASQSNFLAAGYGRYDNTVVYKTPTFAGVTVYAQYSMGVDGNDSDATENKASADRYYALGATYKTGPLALAFVVDSYNYDSSNGQLAGNDDDGITVNFGGSYDFEVVKVYAGAQYFDNMRAAVAVNATAGTSTSILGAAPGTVNEGYGLVAGVDVPVLGGVAKFAAGWADVEDVDNSDKDLQRWGVAAGYTYALSKRTTVYSNVNYIENKYGDKTDGKKPTQLQAMFGLTHKF